MPSRPIWKGAISFGLVHVPVTLYSMEKKTDLHFRLLDSRTKSTIRYERINEVTGEEVPWDKIVKGYEYSKNNYVILDEEDFKKAAIEATQTIDIQSFVAKTEISDLYFDKPYLLIPQKNAEKGYVILREILTDSNRAGIAKVVIRTRQYLAAILPQDQGLVLMLLRFAQELRSVSEFELPTKKPTEYKISAKELDLAKQLVDSQTTEWNPEDYSDEYRDQLLKWIETKVEKGETARIDESDEPEPEMATNVVDLVELLRQSVKPKPKRGSKSSKSA